MPDAGNALAKLLEPDPPRGFDREDVLGRMLEQRAVISVEVETTHRHDVVPSLLPDDEQRRAGAVLPPQHGVAEQRAEVEIAIADRERGAVAGIDRVEAGWVARDAAALLAIDVELELPR